MILKLDASIFKFVRANKAEQKKEAVEPLTRMQWINADRIVLVILLVLVIIGSILA